MFSIYILTYNEEIDIAACIESALLSDDVIVVDSLSSDRTVEIASRYRVQTVQHRFESHGLQRTWMLQSIPTKHEWVYILEADERMTQELFQECLKAIESQEYIGYYAAERVMFMGQWIPRCTQYPRYQLRLFRKDKVWFTDYGHTEREVCDGKTGFLKETYPHYTNSKGLSRWIDKHNRYSTDEARENPAPAGEGKSKLARVVFWLFGSGKTTSPQRFVAAFTFPTPIALFLYVFSTRRLSGWAGGFAWCTLQTFYEYLILLKVWEMKHLPTPYLDQSGKLSADQENKIIDRADVSPQGQDAF